MASIVDVSRQSNEKNRAAVRAIVIKAQEKGPTRAVEDFEAEAEGAGQSKQLGEDPFGVLLRNGDIIEPPFDLLALSMLSEYSTELGPCIETMEVNIEGFGHRYVPRFDATKATHGVIEAALREKVRLENFFAYASLKDSFTMVRRKLRVDLEHTGNGYLEVIRNAAKDIQGLEHIPSYQTRLGVIDKEPIEVRMPVLELQPDGRVVVSEIPTWQRFRRFVQTSTLQRGNLTYVGGYKLRWFKEFGDPREYHNETGEIIEGRDLITVPESERANEVVHFRQYSPRTPYGLPRFIGNLLSIYGDRASEEINFTTFRNQNVPSMMLLISNGQLTEASIERISEFVESQIQGSDNYSKFLLIEAEGLEEGEDGNQVKIDVKPLTDTQHKDALFQNYSQNNQDKIRRSFRLPPILVGQSSDYTRSTADTSRKLADEQVFAPERDEFDSWVNRRLFPDMGIVYHKYRSNSPNTTDNTELVRILAGAEKTGGMSPRIARLMLEDILGQELPSFPDDFEAKADTPFSLLMAAAVKNQADPTEPGQQVTALKTVELIERLTSGDVTETDEIEMAKQVAAINLHFEKRWRRVADEGND